MSNEIQTCWVMTEGIAGTENQCLGIAEALGLAPMVKRIKLRAPWKQLSPWLSWGHDHALAAESDRLDPPYPDLLIASGRKSIGAALHIREKSGGKTFVVQLQDPRIAPEKFDLVAVPQHDRLRGDNVLVAKAGLHRVTPEKLAEAKIRFSSLLDTLPHPRIAVLIGGNARKLTLTRDICTKLTQQLLDLSKNASASLMVTASRRTGAENMDFLRAQIKGDNIYFWDGQGNNPYFGFLAHADYIIVTEDSVSMTSEALATGKPVYTVSLEGGSRRHQLFHNLLQEQGYTRRFTGKLEAWSYDPPNDTMRIAAQILEKYVQRK